MTWIQWLVVVVAIALVGLVVFGLVTGRLDRRAQGCCPADPAQDLRMRGAPDDA
jgi:FtsZ-interacting cell division protein ZipA